MIADMSPRLSETESRRGISGIIRRDGPAVAVAAIATIAVELGIYLLGRACGAGIRNSTLAALATGVLWTAVASGVLAGGGKNSLGSLLRGGIVADASAVVLIVLWLSVPQMTLLAALKVYCIYAAMALAAVAAVTAAKSPDGKYTMGVAAAVVMFVSLTTPLWIGGMLAEADPKITRNIVTWATYANPFYCVIAAVEQMRFVWHRAPLMYHITRIGDSAAPPPVPWFAAAAIYACLAVMLSLVSLLRRRR